MNQKKFNNLCVYALMTIEALIAIVAFYFLIAKVYSYMIYLAVFFVVLAMVSILWFKFIKHKRLIGTVLLVALPVMVFMITIANLPIFRATYKANYETADHQISEKISFYDSENCTTVCTIDGRKQFIPDGSYSIKSGSLYIEGNKIEKHNSFYMNIGETNYYCFTSIFLFSLCVLILLVVVGILLYLKLPKRQTKHEQRITALEKEFAELKAQKKDGE